MIPDTENSSNQPVLERGVYTLANDVVIEWFQAFIRSFRKTNPTLPLTVIPYNEHISRLLSLREQFHFEIMDSSMCSQYDAIADKVKVSRKGAGSFRKFACFFGNYREFLYLDADIVTLVPLDRLFDAFPGSSSQFVYFDTAMDMCYKENLATLMVPQYGSPAYNSGAFFSRRGIITESEIFAAADNAIAICDGFADALEQPFLNYVTDISRLRYADISSLAPDLATVIWVRQPFIYNWKTDMAKNSEGKPMPFIHWPGCAYPTMVKPEFFLRHRTRGLSLPARLGYYAVFYFRRYRVYFLKEKARSWKVIIQFFTSSAWRKFYLCKLIGVKSKLPT
jgi:hypothetical protein